MSTLVDLNSVVAVVAPIDVVLQNTNVSITLDENRAPYCEVTLTCALPSPGDRALIDIRDDDLRLELRVRRDFGRPLTPADVTEDFGGSVTALTAAFGGSVAALTNRFYQPWNGALVRPAQQRFFDLVIIEREFDDVAGQLRIRAASDEANLIGDMLLAASPWNPSSTSLVAIAQAVLNRYGATLATDSIDATVAEVDATLWRPGVYAINYLNPMLEAHSLRLWCDESRTWRISERQSVTAGSVLLTPDASMTQHRDTMTLADPDTWFDAVLVEYRWIDALDLNRFEFDYAGPQPSKSAKSVQRDTVYPGPGAAAGLLSRGQGRGRVLDVDALNDLTLAPGMTTTILPPFTEAQTGYLSALTWNIPGEMSVTTRGLTDTPDTAYLFGPAGYSYLDVPAGVDYTEFDWSMA